MKLKMQWVCSNSLNAQAERVLLEWYTNADKQTNYIVQTAPEYEQDREMYPDILWGSSNLDTKTREQN